MHLPTAPTTPAERASPDEGILYWTGRLKKNETITLEGTDATVGGASGAKFPGSAIDVWLPSPAVALVERPNPQNGWNRVVFRALRSTDRNVTINIQWKRLR